MKRWLTAPTLIVGAVSASLILGLALWGLHQRSALKQRAADKQDFCRHYASGLRTLRFTFSNLRDGQLRMALVKKLPGPAERYVSMTLPTVAVSAGIGYCLAPEPAEKAELKMGDATDKLIFGKVEEAAKLWIEVSDAIRAKHPRPR